MLSVIKDDTKGLHHIIKLNPEFTIEPSIWECAKYDNLHEYAIALAAEVMYILCDTLADKIENDLILWKEGLK